MGLAAGGSMTVEGWYSHRSLVRIVALERLVPAPENNQRFPLLSVQPTEPDRAAGALPASKTPCPMRSCSNGGNRPTPP